MADLKAMAESLVNLTVKEVNELADILKEGVSKDEAEGLKSQLEEAGAEVELK